MTSRSAASQIGRVAALAAIVGLQAYWFLQPVPLQIKGLAAILAAASVANPAAGLLAFAGLAPLSTAIANLCNAGGLGGQLLEQMALAIGAGVIVRGGPADGRTRIGAPALFMAVVALASAASMIPAAAAPVARSLSDDVLLGQLALRDTAQASPVWGPMFAALVVAECGLLAWAVEHTVRRTPALVTRLVAMALIGHAGAAVLNLEVVLGAAMRTGNLLGELPRLLTTIRVSMQSDWNAGASALLLSGVAGLGLLSLTGSKRVGIGLLLVLVALGLWITGSRIAIAMATGAALTAFLRPSVKKDRGRLIAAGLAIVLAASGWLVIATSQGRHTPVPQSVEIRLAMADAGAQMFRQAPVFGIGIAKFYGASATFVGPHLVGLGWRPNENAHNNFVQVLAEQGLVGLAALLWTLGVTLVGGVRAQAASPGALPGALTLAIAACLGTWLTGHPLLVPEFAFLFWLYCGVLASMTATAPHDQRPLLLAALAAGVLATAPMRAYELRRSAGLEHRGFDLSLWQHDDQQRYREASGSFAVYLPARGRPVSVPIKRVPAAPDPLVLEVRVRDQLVTSIAVHGEEWQATEFLVPQRSFQFELVEFSVRQEGSRSIRPGALLRVGRVAER